MQVRANGIDVEVESYGAEDAPAVLLIMGLGAQLTRWPMPMVEALVARGFRAVRFDNRDVGLSTKFDAAGQPDLMAVIGSVMTGGSPKVPYTLDDMAADAAGVLDALNIRRAHIMGASMGGMIAQLFAAHYPARTLSLTSIMSTTGNPAVPRASDAATAVLMTRPDSDDPEALVAHGIKAMRVIGSPGYPVPDDVLRERIVSDARRMHYPAGFGRQMAAIYAGGDRRAALKGITAPTVVVHGADDPLVPIEGGRDTAAAIPGARLVEVPGMGHDLPVELIPTVLDAFESVSRPSATA